MSFTQFKLELATSQARGIFNNYVYETDDTVADTKVMGYFAASRFAGRTPEIWIGSFITCNCSDGIWEGQIGTGDTVTPISPATNGLADGVVPQVTGGALTESGATVDLATREWTFEKAINVPGGASLRVGNWDIANGGAQLSATERSSGQITTSGATSILNNDVGNIQPLFVQLDGPERLQATIGIQDTNFLIIAGAEHTYNVINPVAGTATFYKIVNNGGTSGGSNITIREDSPTNPVPLYDYKRDTNPDGTTIVPGDNDIDLGTEVFFKLNADLFVTITSGDGNISLAGVDIGGEFGQIIFSENTGRAATFHQVPTTKTLKSLSGQDQYQEINTFYTGTAATTAGFVANRQATSTVDTVTGGQFTAGVDGSGNPTIVTDTASVFVDTDIIQVTGTRENDGVYEVLSHAANLLTIKGIGTTPIVEPWSDEQLFTIIDSATITKFEASVLRVNTSGKWEIGSGSQTGFSFEEIQTTSTAFTEGSVPFADSSGDLTQDNANFFWDNANKRLGIGGTPLTSLHVTEGDTGLTHDANSPVIIESTAVSAFIAFSGPNASTRGIVFGNATNSTDGGILYDNTERSLAFRTAGNIQRMVIDNIGRIGVGVSAPNQKLHVLSSGTSTATSLLNRGILITDSVAPRLTFEQAGATAGTRVMLMDYIDGELTFLSLNDLGSAVDVDNILVLTRDGSVGIGTGNPQAPLEVKTSDVTTEATIFTVTSQSGRSLSILQPDIADPDAPFVFATNNAYTFRVDAIDAFTIDDAGIIGPFTSNTITINTVNDGDTLLKFNTPRSWEFQQEGTGSGTDLRLRNTSGFNKNFFIDTDGSTQWRSSDGTTAFMKIDQATGNLGIGATDPKTKLSVNGAISTAIANFSTDTNTAALGEAQFYVLVSGSGVDRELVISSADILHTGRTFIIKDSTGSLVANGTKIRVVVEGGESIDDDFEAFITVDYGVVRLFSNGLNLLSY